MPLREFSRLTDRLLAHLGEEAVLRGGTNTAKRIMCNVAHGVEFADANDQAIFTRSVAVIDKQYLPEAGDRLVTYAKDRVTVTGRFLLDRLLNDNGYSRTFVIVGDPS